MSLFEEKIKKARKYFHLKEEDDDENLDPDEKFKMDQIEKVEDEIIDATLDNKKEELEDIKDKSKKM